MTEERVKEIAGTELTEAMKENPAVIALGRRQLATDWLAQRAEIERLREALQKIEQWTEGEITGQKELLTAVNCAYNVACEALALAALTSTQGE